MYTHRHTLTHTHTRTQYHATAAGGGVAGEKRKGRCDPFRGDEGGIGEAVADAGKCNTLVNLL